MCVRVLFERMRIEDDVGGVVAWVSSFVWVGC